MHSYGLKVTTKQDKFYRGKGKRKAVINTEKSVCIEILSQIKWKLTVEKNPNSIAILNFLSKGNVLTLLETAVFLKTILYLLYASKVQVSQKVHMKLHAVDRWYWPAKEECGEETSRWCFFSTFLFGPTGDFGGLVYLRDTLSLEAGTYTSRKRHFPPKLGYTSLKFLPSSNGFRQSIINKQAKEKSVSMIYSFSTIKFLKCFRETKELLSRPISHVKDFSGPRGCLLTSFEITVSRCQTWLFFMKPKALNIANIRKLKSQQFLCLTQANSTFISRRLISQTSSVLNELVIKDSTFFSRK